MNECVSFRATIKSYVSLPASGAGGKTKHTPVVGETRGRPFPGQSLLLEDGRTGPAEGSTRISVKYGQRQTPAVSRIGAVGESSQMSTKHLLDRPRSTPHDLANVLRVGVREPLASEERRGQV